MSYRSNPTINGLKEPLRQKVKVCVEGGHHKVNIINNNSTYYFIYILHLIKKTMN
jgi:hypothetical protein